MTWPTFIDFWEYVLNPVFLIPMVCPFGLFTFGNQCVDDLAIPAGG